MIYNKELINSFISQVSLRLKSRVKSAVSEPAGYSAAKVSTGFYMPKLKKCENYGDIKSKCIFALRGKKPFEKVFLIDMKTNEVIKEINGDLGYCYIDRKFLQTDSIRILHGHAKTGADLTPPVSLKDFELLNKNKNIKEIIAVDYEGRESSICKGNNYKHLSRKEFNELKVRYIEYLIKFAESQDREKILELQNYCKTHKQCRAVKFQISELLTGLQLKESGIRALDAFWKDMSESIKIEYRPYCL